MSSLYELGRESYKANKDLTHEVLDTMDDEFRAGYKFARDEFRGNGISEATIRLSRVKPLEVLEEGAVVFTLSWADLTLLVESHRYGRLGYVEELQPMRSAIKHLLEKRYLSGEFKNYTEVCKAMDVIFQKLTILADIHSVGE